jgi:hypothetical protein
MTKEPLSEEVTKNTETIKIPIILVKVYNGNAFKKMNNEVEASSKTGVDKIPGFYLLSKEELGFYIESFYAVPTPMTLGRCNTQQSMKKSFGL